MESANETSILEETEMHTSQTSPEVIHVRSFLQGPPQGWFSSTFTEAVVQALPIARTGQEERGP